MKHWMSRALFIVLVGGATVVLVADRKANGTGQPTLPTREIVVNGQRLVVEVADVDDERERGLSFRERLESNHGMLFVFPAQERLRFWMYGMNFPLDMVFIRDGRVVRVASDVPVTTAGVPTVVWPEEEADQILELHAGDAKRLEIRVGTETGTRP